MWFRRRHTPPAPRNVRLQHADGTSTPLECVYEGFRGDMHVWRAVPPAAPIRIGDHLELDELPPHTQVSLTMQRSNGAQVEGTIAPF